MSVTTRYTFSGPGRIHIEREFSEFSDPEAVVTAEEYVKGSWGFTEYPEDLESLHLQVEGVTSAERQFNYEGKVLETADPKRVSVRIPPVNTILSLEPGDASPASRGTAAEGHLFSPYYTLTLESAIPSKGVFKSWIILTPIA